jgi:hypothetical protein
MKYLYLIAAALGSSLFLTDCNKNKEDAAAAGSSRITYQITTSGQTSETGRVAVSDGDNDASRRDRLSIHWTGGHIFVSEIKFSGKGKKHDKDDDHDNRGNDDKKVECKSKITHSFDLSNLIATLGSISIPADTYNNIEFTVSLVPMGTTAAFALTGSFDRNGVTIPVEIRFDVPVEFSFQIPDSINFNADFTALGTLNLDQLLSGITSQMISSAIFSNGKIIISSNSNVTMFKIIFNGMHAMLKVHVKKH